MSATADSSCGELSEAKHLWFIPLSGIGRKIDPRLKAWPRGLRPLRCSFAFAQNDNLVWLLKQ